MNIQGQDNQLILTFPDRAVRCPDEADDATRHLWERADISIIGNRNRVQLRFDEPGVILVSVPARVRQARHQLGSQVHQQIRGADGQSLNRQDDGRPARAGGAVYPLFCLTFVRFRNDRPAKRSVRL